MLAHAHRLLVARSLARRSWHLRLAGQPARSPAHRADSRPTATARGTVSLSA